MFSPRMAWLVLVAFVLPMPLLADADDPEPPTYVRVLKIKELPQEWMGKNNVIVFTKASNISDYGGREVSTRWNAAREEIAKNVKFGTENAVIASYSTGGPRFGELKYKHDRKKREVQFYVTPGGVGAAKQIGARIYTVPAGTKVTWGGVKE